MSINYIVCKDCGSAWHKMDAVCTQCGEDGTSFISKYRGPSKPPTMELIYNVKKITGTSALIELVKHEKNAGYALGDGFTEYWDGASDD